MREEKNDCKRNSYCDKYLLSCNKCTLKDIPITDCSIHTLSKTEL